MLPAGMRSAPPEGVGTERYTLLSAKEQTLRAGDMFIRDQEGILSIT